MSNTIIKALGFDYSSTAIGFPGTPPAPQRVWYSFEPHNQFIIQGPGIIYTWVQPAPQFPTLPYPPAEWTPNVPLGTGTYNTSESTQVAWVNQFLNRPVISIAQPAVLPFGQTLSYPSRTIFDFNLGWNAGARSIGSMVGDGGFNFNFLPSTVGAVAGLNVTDSKGNYANITVAWAVINHHAKVFIAGSFQFDSGPFVATDVFDIRRVLGNIEFRKNGTKVLTYAPGQVTLIGTAFLDVSLYAGGDGIDNPTFYKVNTCGATMLPARAICGLTVTRVHFVNSSMLPATASCGVKNDCRASMAPAKAYCGGNGTVVCSVAAVMQPPVINCFTGVIGALGGIGAPTYALAGVHMEQLCAYATCLTGQIAEVFSVAQPARARGGHLTNAEVQGVSAYPTSYSTAYDGNLVAHMGSQVFSNDPWVPSAFLVAVMTSNGTMLSAMSFSVGMTAAMFSAFTSGSSLAYQAILQAIMTSVVKTTFSTPFANDQIVVWVLNTETMAASQYEQFPYNSFTQIGPSYYGCQPNGIYLLEGDSDADAPVRASLNLGRINMGTLAKKQVPNFYLGCNSEGPMALVVTTDQGTFTYSAKNFTPNMATQRFDLGKGLRGNYYELEIFNQAGANFVMDDLEFRIVKSDTRKVF